MCQVFGIGWSICLPDSVSEAVLLSNRGMNEPIALEQRVHELLQRAAAGWLSLPGRRCR